MTYCDNILRGAHAPSHVIFDALVENCALPRSMPVFGEGAKDYMRGRMCSPRRLHIHAETSH